MRLIDADELRKCAIPCEIHNGALTDLCVSLYQIDNAPTVPLPDFKEGYKQAIIDGKTNFQRPQGEWIKQYNKSYELKTNEGILVGEFTKCPKCQYDKARGSNFCPNCGADMRGEKE